MAVIRMQAQGITQKMTGDNKGKIPEGIDPALVYASDLMHRPWNVELTVPVTTVTADQTETLRVIPPQEATQQPPMPRVFRIFDKALHELMYSILMPKAQKMDIATWARELKESNPEGYQMLSSYVIGSASGTIENNLKQDAAYLNEIATTQVLGAHGKDKKENQLSNAAHSGFHAQLGRFKTSLAKQLGCHEEELKGRLSLNSDNIYYAAFKDAYDYLKEEIEQKGEQFDERITAYDAAHPDAPLLPVYKAFVENPFTLPNQRRWEYKLMKNYGPPPPSWAAARLNQQQAQDKNGSQIS